MSQLPQSSQDSSSSTPPTTSQHASPSSSSSQQYKRRRLEKDHPQYFSSASSLPLTSSFPSSSNTLFGINSSVNLFHELRNLRQFGVLTDITLKSGDCEVKAHRCVLAASSDYFRACLTSSMKESELNCVIELPLIDGDSLYRITDFIYGEDVLINEENIISILDSADKLNLDLLKHKCCTYLSTTLTPSTCFNIYYLADRYNCTELCQEIYSYICRNFEGACNSEEYNQLSYEELLKYLSSDALSVKNESVVFQAILKWIQYSPDQRSSHLLDLFQTVRLRFMTIQDIAQFIHPIMSANGPESTIFQTPGGYSCLLQVMNAYRWHALPSNDPAKRLSDGQIDRPRNYARKMAERNRLFVLGGDDGYDDHSPFNSVLILDEVLKEWIVGPSFSQARSVPGCVAVKDRICVIGGYDGTRASSLMDIFDTTTSSWFVGFPLKQRRCSCVCVSYRDSIYCIGGVCGPQALNSVEKISVNDILLCDSTNPSETNSLIGWVECPSLQENRSACGAVVCVHDNNEIILVCGGITTGGDTVASTEKYSDTTQVRFDPCHIYISIVLVNCCSNVESTKIFRNMCL